MNSFTVFLVFLFYIAWTHNPDAPKAAEADQVPVVVVADSEQR